MARKLDSNPDKNDDLTKVMIEASTDYFEKQKNQINQQQLDKLAQQVKNRVGQLIRVNSVSQKMQDKTPKGSVIHHDNEIAKDIDDMLKGQIDVGQVISRSHCITEMTTEEHTKFHNDKDKK